MKALYSSIGYAKLYFLNSFAKKNKIFATLNIIFNVSKLCAVFKSFLWILDVDVLRIILWKKHYPLKTMHLSTSSFTKYCLHSRFCTSIIFFELLHQCNYQGIKSTFKSTFWWFSCYDVIHILARTIQFSSYLFLFKVVYYESCLET